MYDTLLCFIMPPHTHEADEKTVTSARKISHSLSPFSRVGASPFLLKGVNTEGTKRCSQLHHIKKEKISTTPLTWEEEFLMSCSCSCEQNLAYKQLRK